MKKLNTILLMTIVIILSMISCKTNQKSVITQSDNISDSSIQKIFRSKIYLGLSLKDSSNKYHGHLQMLKNEGVNYFPIYSSTEKLETIYSLNMIMPEFKPFDGILFASLMNDSMIYIINYALPDQFAVSGKQVKKIMKDDILKFNKEFHDLIK